MSETPLNEYIISTEDQRAAYLLNRAEEDKEVQSLVARLNAILRRGIYRVKVQDYELAAWRRL